MKNSLFLMLLLVFSACQTTKIKNHNFKISTTAVELGSIGESTSLLSLQNDFKTKALPKLENEIRLSIDIIPFNKRLAKMYNSKLEFNQSQPDINYVDSLSVKPELAILRILDITGFVSELNAVYNKDIRELLFNTRNLQVVSSIAIALSNEDLVKIRQADSYYLNNAQQKFYTLSLYKQGKKIEVLNIASAEVLGYGLGKFCWSEIKRKWRIEDIVDKNDSCNGNTTSRPSSKKEKNIFKL
ncbi:hypothetical protein ACI6PS_07925 [Flavobacterium sp. PLA-1-15]|uniref:hypothetical protein n=1 Tax=Flavobacterium sp. PLA-1-15 TaxID=3380533 RepID=UPI003B816835